MKAKTKRTVEEIEARMIEKLEDVLYPVFYPIEQQDVAIQAEHRRTVKAVARAAWNSFLEN